MTAFVIRRLILALLTLLLVSLAVFFVMRLLPGDPLLIYMAQSMEFDNMSHEALDELRREFGLDKPVMVQYVHWISGVLRGDFGTSIFYREKVGKLMLERFPVTLHLGLLALLCSVSLGLAVGLIAAIRRGSWPDRILTPLTYLGVTVPVFWLGIILIYVFGLKLHWLPIAGYTSPWENFWLSTRQSIMPVICLAVFSLASNARQMRSSMLEVIHQDYIRTAWAKGLSEGRIILKHAVKNSLIPVITLMGMGVSMVFGGSVIVETVFAIPGIGRLLVSSIFGQDYVVVQAIAFVIASIVLVVNLIVDISYAWLNPKIRYGRKA